MNLTAQNVSETFMECLFKEGEKTDNYTMGEGVMQRVGFNPDRLKKSVPKIIEMLNGLPDSFKSSGGGGMTFLNMCFDKNGNHWGEHANIDQLVCLGNAAGKLSFLLPRENWSILPGGMPYIMVEL